MQYTWSREDGRPFAKGTKFEDLNRVLTIKNAGLDAEGNYICTVNGKGGIKSKVISLAMEGRAIYMCSFRVVVLYSFANG